MLRNGETGDWIGTFQGHKGAVWECVLNDTAMLVATASADFSARVWNALSGDEVQQFAHQHIVRTVEFAHHSPRLVTGGYEQLIRVYDLEQLNSEPMQLDKAEDKIRIATWHQQDNLLLSSYIDRKGFSVWDLRQKSVARHIDTPAVVTSIEVGAGGQHITTAGGSEVQIWDGASLTPSASFPMPHPVETASYCPAKKRFAAGGEDMGVYLYSAESGQELDSSRGHHGPVHCVRFAPGGESYASGSEDGTIRIWATEFAQQEASPLPSSPAIQVNNRQPILAS